jgi:hypothetical protein
MCDVHSQKTAEAAAAAAAAAQRMSSICIYRLLVCSHPLDVRDGTVELVLRARDGPWDKKKTQHGAA